VLAVNSKTGWPGDGCPNTGISKEQAREQVFACDWTKVDFEDLLGGRAVSGQ